MGERELSDFAILERQLCCRLACIVTGLLMLIGGRCAFAQNAFPFPNETWPTADPEDVDLDVALLHEARDYALRGNGSGLIIRHGQVVMSWGDEERLYDLKSSTKSFGATALGVAILDGRMDLDDLVAQYHPEFRDAPASIGNVDWVNQITLGQLATHTAGFEKPGGYSPLAFEPGTIWAYSDCGPNWLAECITLEYERDLNAWMFERVFTPIGITSSDLRWRNNQYREHEIAGIPRREFGSGIHANVNAMARVGYLYLRDGVWNDDRLLPSDFIKTASQPSEEVAELETHLPDDYGHASQHYGLLWWNNGDGTLADVPRDAFWSWGLYDSLIVVIPSLDIVVARAGESLPREEGANHYMVLEPFLGPIARAAGSAESVSREDSIPSENGDAPYPPSPVIAGIEWDPADSITRQARGSDNWPMTWADDDALYTAYGDGRGFEPFVPRKLSLGLVRITGSPASFVGENILSPTVEALGDGREGRKASGILCVDGVLYLLARNLDNSQLAWSSDHGASWTWADWRFETSFGCPTFLNFGRDNAGSRDEYVYVYSHDVDSAYERADRMVLARVLSGQIAYREAWEFFTGLNSNDEPMWSDNIEERAGVFAHAGACYRSSVSYNAGLGRYLWCQTGLGEDTRFVGGLAIYDAPEPWGPWTTVYFTNAWDVGPGESCSFPSKWISDDGLTAHLVFSGDDCFSVRRATLRLRDER